MPPISLARQGMQAQGVVFVYDLSSTLYLLLGVEVEEPLRKSSINPISLGSVVSLIELKPSIAGSSRGINSDVLVPQHNQSNVSMVRWSLEKIGSRASLKSFASLVGALEGKKANDVLWTFLESPSSSVGAWAWSVTMLSLIVASCSAFVIETQPGLCCGRYDHIWDPLEQVCIAFFSFEFCARFIACPLTYGLSGKAAERVNIVASDIENNKAKRVSCPS
jgi:hypothetical protein